MVVGDLNGYRINATEAAMGKKHSIDMAMSIMFLVYTRVMNAKMRPL